MTTTVESNTMTSPKLVDANGLLDALFDPSSKPSLRWLRQMQAQRKIPYVKIGHLVRFDVDQVRTALQENCTVNPKARQIKQSTTQSIRKPWGDSNHR